VTDFQLGFNFDDFYNIKGLEKLDKTFLDFLPSEMLLKLQNARTEALDKKQESCLIIDLAPYVENFISKIFDCNVYTQEIKNQTSELSKISKCQKLFVQRRAVKKYPLETIKSYDGKKLIGDIRKLITFKDNFTDLEFANYTLSLLENDKDNEEKLDKCAQYAAWAVLTKDGKKLHKNSVLFNLHKKLNLENLVESSVIDKEGYKEYFIESEKVKYRDGFKLTDPGPTFPTALNETNYCIYCHERDKDSCSTGIKDKEGKYKISDLNINLTGCPLEEKISEMNFLKSKGMAISALLTAMIDNPFLAATGHRICNDCMKSCIYQTTDPVNIPEIETQTLTQILDLPYGFEIYSLFTRWNPLNFKQPLPKEDSNYKILVVGTGPAGFNLAHYLLRDGHIVVAIDGLKIEPLNSDISGIDLNGNRAAFKPIKNIHKELFEPLDIRVEGGFGGVAEYGITVRWNKNYLQLIRTILERNQNFRLYGGIRFGGQINKEIAFKKLKFDHIALCMGAGSPTIISLKNNLTRGVRKASDFLMSLQLSGAAKKNNIVNLQMRLPAVVVGGGLTAIDTATEILAYYPKQIEKFYEYYNILKQEYGNEYVNSYFSKEDKEIAEEFISHAKELILEKKRATEEGRLPNVIKLLRKWGGVKILYRKSLQESPAYRLNHEEVDHALKEGISFISNISPNEVVLDKYGAARELKCSSSLTNKEITFSARSILIAAGTKPNTIIGKEDPDFKTEGLYFRALDTDGNKYIAEQISKPKSVNVITHLEEKNKAVSFFGDMHPDFSGNVVKAMASSKKGYPVINKVLSKHPANLDITKDSFFKKLDKLLIAKVKEVKRLTGTIVEVIIDAPLAAQNFKPGQFYRLQNFATLAPIRSNTKLAMEGLALTGAGVTGNSISLIVLEMGGSSDICKLLKPEEPVILMGPTGMPTQILKNKTILLAGGGLGNAVLFSIGKAFRNAGSKVLYFAAYKNPNDLYKIKEIEDAADQIVWSFDEMEDGKKFEANRDQDIVFKGNIIEAMESYSKFLDKDIIEAPTKVEGSKSDKSSGISRVTGKRIKLSDIDNIVAIGSDAMMNAVAIAKNNQLKEKFKKNPAAVASINSPMQCMMKEICASCLQKHIDPKTGKEYFVYSCFNQDQDMDSVNFPNLKQRLKQNSLQENITKLWLNHIL